jgi:hypothetical protein
MTGKFWISAAVTFVLTVALSWFVHGFLLYGDYMTMQSWMRKQQEAQTLMGWMFLAHALFSVAFAWIYLQGREDKPWLMQGIRYGIAAALLTVAPTYLIYHMVTPVPLVVAFKQIAFDSVRVILTGIALAYVNRGAETKHG